MGPLVLPARPGGGRQRYCGSIFAAVTSALAAPITMPRESGTRTSSGGIPCHKSDVSKPPILDNKPVAAPSMFEPQALLREARRQKGFAAAEVPRVCILDPDGDIVRRLRAAGMAHRSRAGPAITPRSIPSCSAMRPSDRRLRGRCPFAVLVAEELFASAAGYW